MGNGSGRCGFNQKIFEPAKKPAQGARAGPAYVRERDPRATRTPRDARYAPVLLRLFKLIPE
jgi:hypothetical protein